MNTPIDATDSFIAPEEALKRLTEPLLAWYDKNARILPWRENPAPYRVWVSEIMLQQTRIDTVIPYFHRFMAALPDITALAQAEENVLLKLWEGMGYYARVRNMQRAARAMLARYNGEVPASYPQLLGLPGIGEYTAGAIASIAYQIPVTAVDGNVLRVMARLLACREDITQNSVRKSLRSAVESMLSKERPGDFNQAMMDMGATVCLPNTLPRCELCPIREGCAGYAQGIAADLPVKTPAKRRTIQQRTILVIISRGKALLRQRPAAGLLAGLWEFPNQEGHLTENEAAALVRQWGFSPDSIRKLQDAKHVFTHIEWYMQGYLIYVREALPGPEGFWTDEEAIGAEYALPSAFKPYSRYLNRWLRESM
ncbi:MAG: A/G-specific adenine glycosylase [Clostridia bacterium]|jgi:A/G-specific adenine glycosylase|nr:A/G-specific adenine glycosylase [Clostridia bacterium]